MAGGAQKGSKRFGLLDGLLTVKAAISWTRDYSSRPSHSTDMTFEHLFTRDTLVSAKLTRAIREAYPEHANVLFVVSDRDDGPLQVDVWDKKADYVLHVHNRRYGKTILRLLEDDELEWMRPAVKLIVDHEIGHYTGDGSETTAQLYALSKAVDPIDAISKYVALDSHLEGVRPDKTLERHLKHLKDHKCEKPGDCNYLFPVKNSDKARILAGAETYRRRLAV